MPSILETFIILFESDSEQVKKGAAQAKEVTDKLNKSLASTDTVAGKLGSSFKNLVSNASGALLGLLSVGAIIGGIKAAATYADKLDELSKALGVNIEELSAWGDAVQMSGGTAEGFQETLKSMSASLAAFATKGKSLLAPFFKELGIKMVDARGKARSVIDILPELADAFQKLGKEEAFGMGRKMGLDQGTIMLLQGGRREVDALIARQKELGVVTKEDGEIAAKFNDQLDDTAHSFRSLFTVVGRFVLPAFTDVLKMFERVAVFFRKNSDFIIGGLIGIGSAILYFVTPAILSMLAALAPFLLIAAAVGAVVGLFALLYDDLKNFEKGNQSVIGELIKKWPVVGDILKNLIKVAELVLDAFMGIKNLLVNLFLDPLNAWTIFRTSVNNGVNNLLQTFPQIGKAIDYIMEMFGKAGDFIGDVWDSIIVSIQKAIAVVMGAVSTVSGAYDKVLSFLGVDTKATTVAVQASQHALGVASASPLSSQTSGSILSSTKSLNKNTTVEIGAVNVQTQATDASGIAGAIGNDLNVQMRQVINNFDDGVLA